MLSTASQRSGPAAEAELRAITEEWQGSLAPWSPAYGACEVLVTGFQVRCCGSGGQGIGEDDDGGDEFVEGCGVVESRYRRAGGTGLGAATLRLPFLL